MSQERSRNLHHELRTPINHLVGYADLILEEPDVPSPVSEALTAVRALAMETLTAISSIADSDESVGAAALASLEVSLGTIEGHLSAAAAAAPAALTGDIDRLQSAAARLRTLLGDLSAPGTPTRSTAAVPAVDEPAATVLVVDDDGANREVLSRRLARLGYRVLEAENGAQALEVLRAERIDLVFLDLMMPVLDGIGVLEQRQRDERLRAIPTIMISALDQVEGIARCIELGADDYLTKPFDPVLLKARAAASLEKKRLHDRERELLDTVTRQKEELRTWNEALEQRVADGVGEIERLQSLRRFLPPQLADLIVAGGEEQLSSHRRDITVLFCDLRGFTPFSETSEPEDVMDVLHELHEAICPAVFERGGTLAQFTGDGMMVFLNDPLPCDNPALAGVRLALDMRDRAAGLADGWRRRGHNLGLGVGVASGFATCGRIGYGERFEYTAIGTVPNLSGRLCGAAQPGEVLVSERVYRMVESEVTAEPAGALDLKGLSRPVNAFRITGLREAE